jgi:hypothetical protein
VAVRASRDPAFALGGDAARLLRVVAVVGEAARPERVAVVVPDLLPQHVDVHDLPLGMRRERRDRGLRRIGGERHRADQHREYDNDEQSDLRRKPTDSPIRVPSPLMSICGQ